MARRAIHKHVLWQVFAHRPEHNKMPEQLTLKLDPSFVVLAVAAQPFGMGGLAGEQLCLWVEVDPEAEQKEYTVRVHPTGENWVVPEFPYLEEGGGEPELYPSHLGTGFMADGRLVWHVYMEL